MNRGPALIFCLSFPNGQLRRSCRCRPMDVSRIVSSTVQAQIVQIVSISSSMDGLLVSDGQKVL
jgi:hypothetical protein